MLSLIVFSKNRACQLRAFLDSLEIHTRGMFNTISVIYTHDEGFDYDALIKERPNVNWIKQTEFKENVEACFVHEYTCFATDDDLFTRDLNKGYRGYFTDGVVCFSLRLGLNIEFCYPLQRENKIKTYKDLGECIKWEWRNEQDDFGYPLSITGHIFKTDLIRSLCVRIDYNNPNDFEAKLQSFLDELPPCMISYKESAIFGVPVNKVNNVNDNKNGLRFAISIEELQAKYNQGFSIDVRELPKINAAQQEIKYNFI